MDLLYVPKNCAESVEQFAKYVWKNGWKAMPHHALPNWLRDNDYLLKGHRPPLPSSKECFKSIFRIHTETGNIWTHLIGRQIIKKNDLFFDFLSIVFMDFKVLCRLLESRSIF